MKELEEIDIELIRLEAKIIIERIKEELQEFEREPLETGIKNKTDALKQIKKQ